MKGGVNVFVVAGVVSRMNVNIWNMKMILPSARFMMTDSYGADYGQRCRPFSMRIAAITFWIPGKIKS